MLTVLKEKYLHRLFETGVTLKAFNGVWEVISGIVVFAIPKAVINGWFYAISRNELLEDPRDKLLTFFTNALGTLSTSTQVFAALYIFFHGILNLFLAVQLYRQKHWAYAVSIAATLLSMGYQAYRISIHHSLVLTAITVFDAFFILLTLHEYRHVRAVVRPSVSSTSA